MMCKFSAGLLGFISVMTASACDLDMVVLKEERIHCLLPSFLRADHAAIDRTSEANRFPQGGCVSETGC